MQVLNLDEKNTERMDAINKFTLMDDTFMTQDLNEKLNSGFGPNARVNSI